MRADRFRRMAAVAVTIAMMALPLAAAPVHVRDGDGGSVFGAAGSKTLTIGVNNGAGLQQIGVQAGAFYLQYATAAAPHAWQDFVTYCMEPDELLGVAGIVPGNLQTSVAQVAEYAGRAAALARLYGSWFADSLTSAVRSAAFQVALWEVAFDSGGNLGGGLFQLLGSNADTNAVRAQANVYLATWNTAVMPGAVVRTGSQDLLMTPPTVVPEPATLALFGVGLAGLAFVAARRWRRG